MSKDKNGNLDYDILPTLIGYHLRRAQIGVFNDFVRTMSREYVSPGQFGVLTLIGANPGLSQSALARAVGIERSTMVAVIDTLEARGFVERQPSPVDRRSYALMLSENGGTLLEKLKPQVYGHEDAVAKDLSLEEREELIRLLSKLGGVSG